MLRMTTSDSLSRGRICEVWTSSCPPDEDDASTRTHFRPAAQMRSSAVRPERPAPVQGMSSKKCGKDCTEQNRVFHVNRYPHKAHRAVSVFSAVHALSTMVWNRSTKNAMQSLSHTRRPRYLLHPQHASPHCKSQWQVQEV